MNTQEGSLPNSNASINRFYLMLDCHLFHFLHHLVLQQCGGGELLLSAPPSAAPATLSPSLHSVLPAGGAGGGPVLGAHPPTQQTARPVSTQLPGSAGVSVQQTHTHTHSLRHKCYWIMVLR